MTNDDVAHVPAGDDPLLQALENLNREPEPVAAEEQEANHGDMSDIIANASALEDASRALSKYTTPPPLAPSPAPVPVARPSKSATAAAAAAAGMAVAIGPDHPVQQLIDTENKYVADLKALLDVCAHVNFLYLL